MSFPFNRHDGLIIVKTEVWGPTGLKAILRLALDTGAASTVMSADLLVVLGYNPAAALETVRIVTASAVQSAPRLTIQKISALGRIRSNFPVLAHNLPTTSRYDGLLGLDFFRGLSLTIDFRAGTIELV